MNVSLIGAPGCPRQEVALAIYEHDILPDFQSVFDPSLGQARVDGLALGHYADYRTELWLATWRAKEAWYYKEQDTIFDYSVLDSAVHVITRFSEYLAAENASEEDMRRWGLTVDTVGQITRDSYQVDLLLRVPGYNEEDDWSRWLNDSLDRFFDAYKINVKELDGDLDDMLEQIAKYVEEARDPS